MACSFRTRPAEDRACHALYLHSFSPPVPAPRSRGISWRHANPSSLHRTQTTPPLSSAPRSCRPPQPASPSAPTSIVRRPRRVAPTSLVCSRRRQASHRRRNARSGLACCWRVTRRSTPRKQSPRREASGQAPTSSQRCTRSGPVRTRPQRLPRSVRSTTPPRQPRSVSRCSHRSAATTMPCGRSRPLCRSAPNARSAWARSSRSRRLTPPRRSRGRWR